MQYAEYLRLAQEAARLFESGKPTEAVATYRQLLDSDIADLDKAMMAMNCAIIADKSGLAEEALAWFDRAVGYERPLHRFFVAEQRAAYLARVGKTSDALHVYQELLCRPDLTEADRERLRHNQRAASGTPAAPPSPRTPQ